MPQRLVILQLLLLLCATPALAQEVGPLGAHHLQGMAAFQHVIDTRCVVCHTRQRVDVAIRERRNLEALEKSMTRKGAVLNESDRRVLGAFWDAPFKGKGIVPSSQPR